MVRHLPLVSRESNPFFFFHVVLPFFLLFFSSFQRPSTPSPLVSHVHAKTENDVELVVESEQVDGVDSDDESSNGSSVCCLCLAVFVGIVGTLVVTVVVCQFVVCSTSKYPV